jgi:RNA polymerase sigma-70 factor (ECF subfamily)
MRRSRNTQEEISRSVLPTQADGILVTRCKAGNHAAFVELIQKGSPIARRAIRSILRNTADIDDVMQETAMAAFKAVRSFNERSKFSTWLTRIAINNALMLLRRRKTRSEMSFDADIATTHGELPQLVDTTIGPERSLIQDQSNQIVRNAVRTLPRALREYVELHCFQELSAAEAASSLGISFGAGKSRMFHARRKLARSLTSFRSRPATS